LFSEEVTINLVISVFKEDGFATVTPLRYMMGKARNNDPSYSWHEGKIASMKEISIMSPDYS